MFWGDFSFLKGAVSFLAVFLELTLSLFKFLIFEAKHLSQIMYVFVFFSFSTYTQPSSFFLVLHLHI